MKRLTLGQIANTLKSGNIAGTLSVAGNSNNEFRPLQDTHSIRVITGGIEVVYKERGVKFLFQDEDKTSIFLCPENNIYVVKANQLAYKFTSKRTADMLGSLNLERCEEMPKELTRFFKQQPVFA